MLQSDNFEIVEFAWKNTKNKFNILDFALANATN